MSRERSFAWMYQCLGSRVAEWFHMRKNEGVGEECPNKTPPYAVYLDSICTPSGYTNGFCLVCLAVGSRCISVRVLPWCWSHGVLHNSQRTLLFIFPQRWSCSMCILQNMLPSAFLLNWWNNSVTGDWISSESCLPRWSCLRAIFSIPPCCCLKHQSRVPISKHIHIWLLQSRSRVK